MEIRSRPEAGGDAVTEAAVRAAAEVGIEVRHVVVKDIVLPHGSTVELST